jgi:hypothetical protein
MLLGLTLSGCGVEWFPDVQSTTTTTVTAFSFVPAAVTDVALNSVQTSSAITVAITGASTSSTISVTGGSYSIDGAAYKTESGTVNSGSKVTVQHTAGSTGGQKVTTTLTIGDKSAQFSSTTAVSVAAFTFTPASYTGVAPGTTKTSDLITLALTGGTSANISITDGEYILGSVGTATTASGVVQNGETVLVRNTASATLGGVVTTVLTVGNASAKFTTTTATVAAQTVNITGGADTSVIGQATLHLVAGSHTVSVVSGTGRYFFNTDLPSALTQTFTLADGQTMFFNDFAPSVVGDVSTTVFSIDGVLITFNLTATL